MAGRGKKKIISDEEMAKAEEMALMNCNNNTIATALGWDKNLIEQREDIKEKLQQKRAQHKIEVRQSQWNSRKVVPMAMFLGKNVLGQSDKQAVQHGVSSEVSSLLKQLDGKTAGVLPSEEKHG